MSENEKWAKTQFTREQAIAMYESGVWKNWTAEQVVRFQMFQERLCMEFSHLIRVCDDYIKTAKLCEEKQHELMILKQDLSETRAGIDRTLTHLKIDKPLALIIEKSLIVISDRDVTVEKNVL
jgi:hypothetical protein